MENSERKRREPYERCERRIDTTIRASLTHGTLEAKGAQAIERWETRRPLIEGTRCYCGD